MAVDQRMPNDGSKPSAKASTTAVSRKFRNSFAVNYPCAIKLFVNGIDDVSGVHLCSRQMAGHALHIGSMLVIEIPPCAFIAIRTRNG